MKRLKKAWLPAFCLALSLLLTSALAADTEPQTTGSCGDNATWSYDGGTQTLTVSGSGEVRFDSLERFPYWDTTKKVVVEEGITALSNSSGSGAYRFKAMTEVSLPNSLKKIGSWAFADCEQLKAITIPDGVTEIGGSVFWDCKNLEHVVIPASVTTFTDTRIMYDAGFGQPVFQGCAKLTSAGPIGSGCAIEFGWTDQIPARAFLGCRTLEQITFPEGMTKIGDAAFAYTGLSTLTVPNTVTSIENEAFYGCHQMETLELSASVVRIGLDAFRDCESLNQISVAEENPIYQAVNHMLVDQKDGVLVLGAKNIVTAEIPETVREIGERAFQNCTALNQIMWPKNLERIGSNAFEGCTALTRAEIPSGAWMSERIFEGCTNLEEIWLPNNQGVVSHQSLGVDTQLKTVRIREGVEGLNQTFNGYTGLTTVYLPASLTEIERDTFKDCTSLTTVYFAGSENQWKRVKIAAGNPELDQATVICTGTDPVPDPTPGVLELEQMDGGLGKRLTVSITGGHWLTVQVRRENSVSITMIQAAGKGTVPVYFSAPVGSTVQVWETEELMQFDNGVPDATVLASGSAQL